MLIRWQQTLTTRLPTWRWQEAILLLFPLTLALAGFWLLNRLEASAFGPRWWPYWVFVGLVLIGHVGLARFNPAANQIIYPIAITLTTLGLLLIERLAPNFTLRHLLNFGVGIVLMVGLAGWPHLLRTLERYRYTLILPGIVLLVFTILLSFTPLGNGQSLFLRIGPIGFQPSEPLKVLLVIFLAGYLDFHREKFKHIRLGRFWRDRRWLWVYFPMLLMWGFAMLLVVAQRDLGAALLFFGTFLILTYLATERADYVLIGLGLFVAGAFVAMNLFSHVAVRIAVWRDPWRTATTTGFQIVQALLAVASGGILGQGLGQGFPDLVPVVHSDFIFVALAEEFGLVGVSAVIALYMLLLDRGFRIARQQNDSFHFLLAAGLTALICLQAFIIMAGSVKLMPLTGITLPFMSYGGSSIMTVYAAIGILLNLSSSSVLFATSAQHITGAKQA
nr:FtsW/RodA/SpoVE family cell cycle protein [Ardenticatena sp.]